MRKGSEQTISSQNKYLFTVFNSSEQEISEKPGIFFTWVSYILIWDFGKALFQTFFAFLKVGFIPC